MPGQRKPGALSPPRPGVTRGSGPVSGRQRAQASPHRAGEDGDRPPGRLRGSVGRGRGRPDALFPRARTRRDPHPAEETGTEVGAGPRLGADLRPQFPDIGRRRPRAHRSPQWTHLGAATNGSGQRRREGRHCGTAWMSEDSGRWRGSTAGSTHATRTFLRMLGAGGNEAAARAAAQSGASPDRARESGSSAPWWSGVQILTLEGLG